MPALARPALARPDAIQRLRSSLEGAGPGLAMVTGPSGVGKTMLLASALRGRGGSPSPRHGAPLTYRASPLPDPDHRALFALRLAAWLDHAPTSEEHASPSGEWGWDALLGRLAGVLEASRRPCVLVVDDAERLFEPRGDFAASLARLWIRARAHALPLHLVLSGARGGIEEGLAAVEPLPGAVTLDLPLEPLPFRRVAAIVPRWDALDRLRAWMVFGGLPGRLAHLDPFVTLATNVQRLVLEPGAPLRLAEERSLTAEVQSPARYATLLRAMAAGNREWGGILAGAPELDSGGTMAPYLSRLEAMGRIRSERSLDAAPRSRSRRYAIEDPFLAFWYRLVLPFLTETEWMRPGEVWARHVRPGLEEHVEAFFPRLCRTWSRLHGDERLPARAREVGGLWGSGYDLPVAGTLANGSPFYGCTLWGGSPPDGRLANRVAEELRETRYGYGREVRHRLVFATAAPTADLVRRTAQDPRVHVVGPADLLGIA